jgi:hypothetical protein
MIRILSSSQIASNQWAEKSFAVGPPVAAPNLALQAMIGARHCRPPMIDGQRGRHYVVDALLHQPAWWAPDQRHWAREVLAVIAIIRSPVEGARCTWEVVLDPSRHLPGHIYYCDRCCKHVPGGYYWRLRGHPGLMADGEPIARRKRLGASDPQYRAWLATLHPRWRRMLEEVDQYEVDRHEPLRPEHRRLVQRGPGE